MWSGAERQLFNRNIVLSQFQLGVIEQCVTFPHIHTCICSMSRAPTNQSCWGNAPCSGACLAALYFYIFLYLWQPLRSCVLLVSCCLCSPSPYAYLLLLLATGVVSSQELNLTWGVCRWQNDWCAGFCQLHLNKCKPFWLVGNPSAFDCGFSFLCACVFRCCFIKPPHKSSHTQFMCSPHY